MKKVRLILTGVGNLGQRFCKILFEKSNWIQEQYGLRFVLVGAVDSGGAAYNLKGLDLAEILLLKATGGTVSKYAEGGRPDWTAQALVGFAEADVLLETTPVNLQQRAEPGLSCIRLAMRHGMHVITPNKGPLALAYRDLCALAQTQRVQLRFDGAVAGGLPAINLGMRDMRGSIIQRLDAIPNLATGYVMDLASDGMPWEEALNRARQEGVLEGDGTWDLEGWDAAAKLVILANAVLKMPATLDDVSREGILNLSPAKLIAARNRGERYRLLACAELQDEGDYRLSVAPAALTPQHPFGNLGRKHMAVRYVTDIYGTLTSIIEEPDPTPSAATMLRDLLDIYS
ncbi:MAG: homoserine dehydrogenase [Anaerolineae bacterium]|nr:homoserine dehydrogenase [Anaerolineae bacterium]